MQCLVKNADKYQNVSVLIEKKVTKIDKNCTGNDASISYKIKFIGSLKFMATSLSTLVDNLT